MGKRISFASAVLAVLTALLTTLLVLTLPAVAFGGPRAEKSNNGKKQETQQQSDNDGDADSDEATATEDSHEEEEGVDDNAHPSGKDRSAEYGGSGNQGKAESNPDDTVGPQRFECSGESERGDDKPNGPGGCDAEDQDGNNGCGNDDDFDDDNNGWCGPRLSVEAETVTETEGCVENCSPCSTTNCPPVVQGDTITKDTSTVVTVTVDCYSVIVTSTKDISNVEVFFADGTSVKYEGLSGTLWTKVFSKPLSSATATSSTTIVSDTAAGNCTQVASGGETCPDGSPMPTSGVCPTTTTTDTTCPDGSPMPANGKCDTTTTTGCPEGTMTNADGTCTTTTTTCPDGSPMPANGKCDTMTQSTCPDGSMPNTNGTCTTTTTTCPNGTMPTTSGCAPIVEGGTTCPAGTMPTTEGCVVTTCPAGTMPTTSGTCAPVTSADCPAGMVAADGGDCVPTTVGGDFEEDDGCPTGQVMSLNEGECVKDDDVPGGTTDFPNDDDGCPTGQVMSASEGECVKDDDVLGGTIDFPGDDVLGSGSDGTDPVGTAAERATTAAAPGGATLPFTGAGVIGLVLAALALIGAGVTVLRRSR